MMQFVTSPVLYVYYLAIIFSLIHTAFHYTKFKDSTLDTVVIFISLLLFILIASLTVVIFINAGFIFNLTYWLEYLIIVLVIFYLPFFSLKFQKNKKLAKKLMIGITLTPFFILIAILHFTYVGNKIYKISKYCDVPIELEKVVCNYKDGKYIGQLKAFSRHGNGTYEWNSGSVYVGEWKNNLMHGSGTMTQGEKILKGQWKKNKFVQ